MSRQRSGPLLVRLPNWLGDLVLALPVLEAAAVHSAIFVGPEPFREILAPRFPSVPYIAASRSRRLAPLGAIRAAKPHAALLLTESLSSAILAWVAGVPERIGYGAEGRGILLTRRVRRAGPPRTISRTAEYSVLAKAIGLAPRAELPSLKELVGEVDRARELLDQRGLGKSPYIVVAPGATYGPAKQWGAVRFAKAAATLSLARAIAVVAVGSVEDRPAAATVIREAGAAGACALDLAGATTLGELVGVLAGARAVLSNDSGVMHLAVALRRPTVAIFGSTSPLWTSSSVPWAANLYAAYPCSPCYRRTCPIGYACFRSVEPASAVRAIEQLLEDEGQSRI